jgi:NAD-dependent DNA ligase
MDYSFINARPQDFIKTNKKKDIINVLIEADKAFFNSGQPKLTDDIYDIIKDYIRKKYPKDAYLKRVGADVDNKVVLPYYMGSQNKIKDSESEITKYKKKYPGPYLISDKLDGVSGMFVYEGDNVKLYTRGNGREGQDISHLHKYISGFPKIKKQDKLAVRGEFIISKDNWDKLKKVDDTLSNPRNTVSGAINSKILNKQLLKMIDFVAYTLVFPNLPNGLPELDKMKFNVVNNTVVDDISLAFLSKNLEVSRKNKYVIDGIVISDISKVYEIALGKNPEYSFAFKSIHTLEQIEVIVKEVEWNISKDKYMKPIVKFDEILLDDVKIKQATGFNAGYIEKNNIGPGSRIVIIRSGNVIPHIQSVLTTSANGKPSMPGELDKDYKWNDTRVDIIKIGEDRNADFDIKNIVYFMKTAEVDNMGPGNITKIYNAGFHDIKSILKIQKEDLLKIEGFKGKSADNILKALEKVKELDCLVLMDASNMLGRGFSYKKIKMITDVYPSILIDNADNREKSLKISIEDLMKVEGIAKISAKLFIENLPRFYEFYDSLGVKCKGIEEKVDKSVEKTENANIKDKKFIFTGFRNKDYEKIIVENGGKVVTSISKSTHYLIVKNKAEKSGKIDKATELGVKILDIPEFEMLIK